jgi:hypothetical protein
MKDLDQRIERLIGFYESRRVTKCSLGQVEPKWNLVPFTSLYRWQAGDRSEEDRESAENAVTSLEASGPYADLWFIEDGFKVGSTSWVFMGRNLPSTQVIPCENNAVILGRTPSKRTIRAMAAAGRQISDTTRWIAYSLTVPLHLQGVGACESFDRLDALRALEFRS